VQKWMVSVMVASALLAACSGVKSKVIPSDPSKWDSIAADAKNLSDADRTALTAYLMRISLGGIMGGKAAAIPPGTTIGQAIEAQNTFEARQKLEEANAEILKAKVSAERAAQISKLNQAVTVVLSDLTVQGKDYDAGRFSDRLALSIAVANHTQKAISGIKGAFVFKDQFGEEISTMRLSLDEDVLANATRSIGNYGKDINQFEASDTKLSVTPLSKMHVAFVPEMIVFTDGSKLSAPDGG
jgi:hypothetical protein